MSFTDFITKRVNSDDADGDGEKKVAILTTTNIMLAERLCTKIAIIADGEILAVNTPGLLRKLYGNGYTLEILIPRVANEEETEDRSSLWSKVQVKIEQRFGTDIQIFESFLNRRVYLIPMHALKKKEGGVSGLQSAFNALNSLQADGFIQSFTLSMTSLQQVILYFNNLATDNQTVTKATARIKKDKDLLKKMRSMKDGRKKMAVNRTGWMNQYKRKID